MEELSLEEQSLKQQSPKVPDLQEKMGRPSTEAGEQEAARRKKPLGMSMAIRERDAIDRLLDRMGGRSRFEALGKIRVLRLFRGIDRHGERVFEHQFHHVLDVRRARSDTVEWTLGDSYGRSGRRNWARSAGLERPDREKQAKELLEVWGLLARFPFVFGDRTRFELESEQRVVLLGRSYIRLRLRERSGDISRLIGPRVPALRPKERRFDIYLEAEMGLPLLLEIRDGARRMRVLFEDFRRLPGSSVTLPMGRILLGADMESPRATVKWKRVDQMRG
ncbi:MAG: hypothetical protein CSA62_12430 [Planctomycetota bacterium]|nr:MAG: hypothetical protein CSA62_12430 [Planctomycetota bacterium]